MRPLQQLLESILDQDLDINLISFDEFLGTAESCLDKKMTKKRFKEFIEDIDRSFELTAPMAKVQQYFCTIEVHEVHGNIEVYYDPKNGTPVWRYFSFYLVGRNGIGAGCVDGHYLNGTAYQIPYTKENLKSLEALWKKYG